MLDKADRLCYTIRTMKKQTEPKVTLPDAYRAARIMLASKGKAGTITLGALRTLVESLERLDAIAGSPSWLR